MIVLFDGLVAFIALLVLLAVRAYMIAKLRKKHRNPRARPKMTYWRMLFAFTKWSYDDFYH